MGLMVAFLPSEVDAHDLHVPSGDDVDQLHTTLRYYGDVTDDQHDELCGHAERIARTTAPFVASIVDRGQLGNESPPADVLHLESPDGEFDAAYNELPAPWDPEVTVYPTYKPHLTEGYGVDPDEFAAVDDTVGIRFDRIAVANGDDWVIYPLEGNWPAARAAGFKPFTKKKRTPSPSFTKKQRDEMADSGEAMAGGEYPIRNSDKYAADDLARAIQAIGRAKDRAAVEKHIRSRAKALGLTDKLPPWLKGDAKAAGLDGPDAVVAGSRGRKNKRQKCLHGSKATCKSVKWITAYTAMRERRGFSKEKAARIANAMENAWLRGEPWGRPGRKGLIKRKRFP